MKENQLDLNKKLFNLLCDPIVDLEQIELVLNEGADPMGSADERDSDEHIFGEILCWCSSPEDGSPDLFNKLPEITQLFIDHGMRIVDDPNNPFDGDNINPLWCMFFCVGEPTISALNILLDNGLSADVFEEFLGHAYTDIGYCYGNLVENNSDFKHFLDLTFKMIFLGASYPHIINKSKYLRDCISYDENSYNLTRFRNWDDYVYEYDLSTARNLEHGLADVIVKIREVNTGNVIWKCCI